jgi:hypothetical protein
VFAAAGKTQQRSAATTPAIVAVRTCVEIARFRHAPDFGSRVPAKDKCAILGVVLYSAAIVPAEHSNSMQT